MTYHDAMALAALLFGLFLIFRMARSVTKVMTEAESNGQRLWRIIYGVGAILMFFFVAWGIVEPMKTHPFIMKVFFANGLGVEAAFAILLVLAIVTGFADGWFAHPIKKPPALQPAVHPAPRVGG